MNRATPTTQFDAYLIVDWSANNRPKRGTDSIWYGLLDRDGPSMLIENPATRTRAVQQLADHLSNLRARDKSTLVGFDFAYGYTQGFAHALGLRTNAPWRAIWDLLSARIHDDERNRNNRFAVAATLNAAVSGTAAPFWGCPLAAAGPCLTSTRPLPLDVGTLPTHRITEERQPGPHSVWKLCYPGAVGSQVLMGIPALARLRDHPGLRSVSRVWPFETGFPLAPRNQRDWTILYAEVYPSLYPHDPAPGECKDRAQVRCLATRLARDDEQGALHQRRTRIGRLGFATPTGLTAEDVMHCTTEEGWILGMQ